MEKTPHSDENDVKTWGVSRIEPIPQKETVTSLRMGFECPYCKVRTLVNGWLYQSRPQKLYEFDFKCENCQVAWEIREVR